METRELRNILHSINENIEMNVRTNILILKELEKAGRPFEEDDNEGTVEREEDLEEEKKMEEMGKFVEEKIPKIETREGSDYQ